MLQELDHLSIGVIEVAHIQVVDWPIVKVFFIEHLPDSNALSIYDLQYLRGDRGTATYCEIKYSDQNRCLGVSVEQE